jgi:SPP1 gp7 family putative phage head morphogenesis protein
LGLLAGESMKYDLWEPKRRIETNYAQSLANFLKSLWKMALGLEDPLEIENLFRYAVLTDSFKKFAQATASKMVTSLFTDAGRTWRTAARENARGRELYQALQNELMGPVGDKVFDEIIKNAELIRTLPLDTAEYINRHIRNEVINGKRASDIAREIKELFPEKSHARAELIARTEVSKVNTALTQARCENLGLDWYVWRTEKDARVRESHRRMEGVLVNWSDPPSPEELAGERSYGKYHAGNIFNCRCYPEPLTRVELIQWPHKVYHGGKIQMMTRAQFERMAGQ